MPKHRNAEYKNSQVNRKLKIIKNSLLSDDEENIVSVKH
jgi:hypothetical protein